MLRAMQSIDIAALTPISTMTLVEEEYDDQESSGADLILRIAGLGRASSGARWQNKARELLMATGLAADEITTLSISRETIGWWIMLPGFMVAGITLWVTSSLPFSGGLFGVS